MKCAILLFTTLLLASPGYAQLDFDYRGQLVESDVASVVVVDSVTVTGSTVTVITDPANPLDVIVRDLVFSTDKVDVSSSVVALKGANGTTITSESVVGGQAIHVINKGATNLEGLNFVYVSSSNFVVGSTLTLTGLGNLVELQSYSGNCDWSIDSGDPIRVSTDTERRFPMEHLILNPGVHLVSKNNADVVCTAFVSGAN